MCIKHLIFANQMFFLKQIGQIKQELDLYKGHKEKTKELRTELTRAVNSYYDNLKRLTKGKFSNVRNAMFEHRMPFSTRGIINSLSSDQIGYQGVDGIPTDSVYMHEDDSTKLITGGKVKSQKQAKAVVNFVGSVKEVQNRLKGIPREAVESTSADELLEASKKAAQCNTTCAS